MCQQEVWYIHRVLVNHILDKMLQLDKINSIAEVEKTENIHIRLRGRKHQENPTHKPIENSFCSVFFFILMGAHLSS